MSYNYRGHLNIPHNVQEIGNIYEYIIITTIQDDSSQIIHHEDPNQIYALFQIE